MILVCDKTKSKRAAVLREKILLTGYPCAVSRISDIADYLPLVLIVTFVDVFDDVRRTPYDDVHVIAIGQGFVNSALNSTRVDSEADAIEEAKRYIYQLFHITKDRMMPFGVFYDTGVFMAADFFEIYGNMIIPTDREYLIFKYLHMAYHTDAYIPAERVCAFCYRASKMPKSDIESAKNLAVHVANLNQKAYSAAGYLIIKAKRFIGYRLTKID